MRTKEEIMKDGCYKENFDTLAEKHGWLLIKIACDRRADVKKAGRALHLY